MNRDIKEIVRDLIEVGWTVKSQNKHIKMQSPRGSILSFSVSPSCPFAPRKIRRDAARILENEQKQLVEA